MGEVIRRMKNGKFIGYYLRFYEAGRRRILASKQSTFAEARRMLQAIEGRLARGLAGLDEPAEKPSITVAELCEKFLAEFGSPRIKDLEREVRELRQANEILRKASAYCAQAALDRRFTPLSAEIKRYDF